MIRRRFPLCMLALLFACDGAPTATDDASSGDGGGKEDDPAAISGEFGFPNLTTLETPPDIGFCQDIILEGDPVMGNPHTIVNTTNAHYLGYISGNAYADFVHFATEMEVLGFGTPGEGSRLTRCGADLARLRRWESRRFTTGARGTRRNLNFDPYVTEDVMAVWGECAAEWYRAQFGANTDAPEGVDGMFEIELTGTAHDGARLEFFSGGEFDVSSHRFDKGTTQLIWAEHRDLPLVVVAFRGTEFQDGAEDLWADLNAGKDPFHGWGDVHRGFSNALQSVMPLLDAKVAEIEGTNRRVWVTGHSLGAALATMWTAEMLHQIDTGASNIDLVGTYTFGSPRVGDEGFRIRFEELAVAHDVSVWRFRNDRDVVTRVPLSFNFDHVGGLAHFEGDTIILQSMLDDTVPRGIISDLWEHHFMGAYYSRLDAWNGDGLRTMRLGVDQIYNCIPAPASSP